MGVLDFEELSEVFSGVALEVELLAALRAFDTHGHNIPVVLALRVCEGYRPDELPSYIGGQLQTVLSCLLRPEAEGCWTFRVLEVDVDLVGYKFLGMVC